MCNSQQATATPLSESKTALYKYCMVFCLCVFAFCTHIMHSCVCTSVYVCSTWWWGLKICCWCDHNHRTSRGTLLSGCPLIWWPMKMCGDDKSQSREGKRLLITAVLIPSLIKCNLANLWIAESESLGLYRCFCKLDKSHPLLSFTKKLGSLSDVSYS